VAVIMPLTICMKRVLLMSILLYVIHHGII